MARKLTKQVMSFALKTETIEELKRVAEESGIVGGRSLIVEDAVSMWLKRYAADPQAWLLARGMPVQGVPVDDI